MIVQQEESLGNSDLLLTTQSKLTAGVLRAPNNAQSLPKPCNLCFSIFHLHADYAASDQTTNFVISRRWPAQPAELQSVRLQTSEGGVHHHHQHQQWHVSIRMDRDLFFFCISSLLAVHPFRRLPLPRENRISVLCPAGNRKLPAETLSSASLRRITSWLLEDNVFLLLFSTPKSFGIRSRFSPSYSIFCLFFTVYNFTLNVGWRFDAEVFSWMSSAPHRKSGSFWNRS